MSDPLVGVAEQHPKQDQKLDEAKLAKLQRLAEIAETFPRVQQRWVDLGREAARQLPSLLGAVAALPALLDEVEAQRAEIERLRHNLGVAANLIDKAADAHEQIVMDTEEDRALNARVVVEFRKHANTIRRSALAAAVSVGTPDEKASDR